MAKLVNLFLIASVASVTALSLLVGTAAAAVVKPPKPVDLVTPKNHLVKFGISIGGVKIGYGRTLVTTMLGMPDLTVTGSKKSYFCDSFGDIGVGVCYSRKPGTVPQIVQKNKSSKNKTKVKSWNGHVVSVSTVNPGFKTASGLGIGSSLDELLAQLPGGESLDYGPDAYGNPPDAHAYEVKGLGSAGANDAFFFFTGTATDLDPAVIKSYSFVADIWSPTLREFLESQQAPP